MRVIGWRPRRVTWTTVARPLYVTAEGDVDKNAGRGAPGFRASEHAPTNSPPARAATGGGGKGSSGTPRLEVPSPPIPKTRLAAPSPGAFHRGDRPSSHPPVAIPPLRLSAPAP